MDMSTMPKPLVYSLSLVLTAIGIAVAYQVAAGSDLQYEGPLGAIKVGQGDNQTTLTQYLTKTETALSDAQLTIGEQESRISQLRTAIVQYQTEVSSLKALIDRLRAARDQNQRRRIDADISRKFAALNTSVRSATELTGAPSLAATQKSLRSQVELTREVRTGVSASD